MRLGRRGHRVAARLAAGNAALGLFAVFMLVDLERVTSHDYPAQLVTVYQRDPGLRAHGREISNIYAFDAGGKPARTLFDRPGRNLGGHDLQRQPVPRPRELVDGDGNEVANRYPQAQQEIDPATGRRSAVPAPEFRPPPGPVRSP